jgi:hypothetical protein
MRLSDFANAYKHSLAGVTVGVGGAGLSCWVTEQLVHLAKLDTKTDSVHRFAEYLLSISSATAVYVLADNVLGRIGPARMDPTNGVFFNIAFIVSQPRLIGGMVSTAQTVKKALPTLACCDDCAEGKPCAGY